MSFKQVTPSQRVARCAAARRWFSNRRLGYFGSSVQGLIQRARPGRRVAILVSVIALFTLMLVAISAGAWRIVSGSFAQLEQRQGERAIERANMAFEADLDQLRVSTHDYASWDNAYEFMRTRDAQFIRSDLTSETLNNMRVDVVWILDTQNAEVLSLEASKENLGKPLVPADKDILEVIRAHLSQLGPHAPGSTLNHLLSTPKGPLAVEAYPILRTNGRGLSRGTMIFGRYLDAEEVLRAQATSRLAIQVFPATARNAKDWPARGADIRLVPTSTGQLSCRELLRDIDHQPLAIIQFEIPRTVTLFGRETTRALNGIFVVVFGSCAAIVAWLLLHLDKLSHARRATERRYRAVVQQAHETILLVDAQSRRILQANPVAASTLKYSAQELLQMDIDELFYACDGDVLQPSTPGTGEANAERILIVRRKDRQFIDVELSCNILRVDGRNVASVVLRDVSARKRAERQLIHHQDRLAHLAHHDMLTGLLNRLGLERRMSETIALSKAHDRFAAFLYIDLDHFKKINDLRGHACGDKLLKVAADRLRNCLAAEDLIARMGGDEFVVVAGELQAADNARVIAARIREALAVPFEVDDQRFRVTASIGVSVYPQDGADYEILLKNADIALYVSKEAGRDTYTVFSNDMTRRVSERIIMESEISDAIIDGQFYLEYQPLVDANTQRVASLEALVRWQHPTRGRVPPLEFITIAERTGQIDEIGAFVIREACRQLGEWQQAGLPLVPIAVNVSSKQLEQRQIVNLIREAIAKAEVPPTMLRIEITESVFMDASDLRVQHLNELRRMGVTVSVDDFGTGYSSLAYLKKLPVDCLKIDRAFVRDIDTSSADEEIVGAIIRVAKGLGMTTVAEGVETARQAQRLRDLGATYIQGFFFSPPVSAVACSQVLARLSVEAIKAA